MATARTVVTKSLRASSTSPPAKCCRASAPARPASGLILSAWLVRPVARRAFVRQIREVEAVHEVPEHRQSLLVDDRRAFLLVLAALVGLRDDAGRIHHLGGDKDRALDADGKRDRVRRPRVEIELAAVLFHIEAGVEHLIREARDHDALDAHPEVAESARHEVVREGPSQRVARDLSRDRLRLGGADPDRQVPVGLLLLEDHEVLRGGHVDPDGVDRDLDEVFHPRAHSSSGTWKLILAPARRLGVASTLPYDRGPRDEVAGGGGVGAALIRTWRRGGADGWF